MEKTLQYKPDNSLMVLLNVLLKEEIQRSLWLRGAHKIEMVMVYLMQVIGVLITLTQDVLEKILNSISLWRQIKCASLVNRVVTGYEDEPMTLWNHFSYDDFLIGIYF